MIAIRKSLDASRFLFARSAARKEFLALLAAFVRIYEMIIKSRKKFANDEETIRDEFLKHVKDAKIANAIYPLMFYSTDAEPKEKCNGYLDLKITPRKPYADPEEYFSIECKRLDDTNQDGKTGLNAKYVKNGIDRYRKGKYSVYHRINGMFGFIVARMDISNNVQFINGFLEETEHLRKTKDVVSFNQAYMSRHPMGHKKVFELYHLMFDFSKKIKKVKGDG